MKRLYKACHISLTTSPTLAAAKWSSLMSEGMQAHQQASFAKALQCFGAAADVAETIVHLNHQSTKKHHAVDMWALASHNLFATLYARGDMIKAEKKLRQLHKNMMSLCLKRRLKRHTRIAALANLDTSLFTLTSHLAHLGKVTDIYPLIAQTESVATQAAKQLFH